MAALATVITEGDIKGEWMDEGVLCEARKVERGMECKKSRGSSGPQQCSNLYGDQQTEGKGLCACI